MTDDNNPHRRATNRVPLQAMITYRLDGQEYGNLAADVSPDGIFIRTFMPPAVGTDLELTVRMPEEAGGFQVELMGRVQRRVDDNDPRHNGMGVQFIGVRANDLAAVRFLVAHIFGCELPPLPKAPPPAPDPEAESSDERDPMEDGDPLDESDPLDDGKTIPE